MRRNRIFAILAGLTAFASIGLVADRMASAHSRAASEPAQSGSMMQPMMPPGKMGKRLEIPPMDAARGRKLFAGKGCVVCHSINGVGGEDAPPLDAKTMPKVMNPFDFAAKMWRGAGVMISVQEEELGEQIEFNGNELADIIAFVHDTDEQKKFSEADIPPKIKKLMGHMGDESEEHQKEEHGAGK